MFPTIQSFVTIIVINPSTEKKLKKVHVLLQGQRKKKVVGVIALMEQILSRDVYPAFSFKDPFFLKTEVFQPWNFRSFFPR